VICSLRLENARTTSLGIPTIGRLPHRSASPQAMPSERVSARW
jgi:hypothetical protein